LYGALGEDLFAIYARRKSWIYWNAKDFLLSLKNYKVIDQLSHYEYKELVDPFLSICFENRLCHQSSKDIVIAELKKRAPDFIVWERYQFGKKPFFVEVKSNESQLSEHQKQLFSELKKYTQIYILRIRIPDISFKVNLEEFDMMHTVKKE
jgi:VRR-NUC domain